MIRMTSIQNSTTPAVLQRLFQRFASQATEVEIAHTQLHEDLSTLKLELKETQEELERKRDELQIATDYLDALLGHISQGILFLDPEGTIVIYNDAAGEILGKPSDNVLFRPFWDNFSDETFGFSVKSALKTQHCPATLFVSWESDEGQKNELEISPSFFSKQNKVEGLVIRVRNITEIRRLEVTANRHDRLTEIGSMVSKVAHEIRNPLGGIKGFASLLERDLKEQPKMQEMAKAIVDGADELNELVSNILDYSRPLNLHIEKRDLVEITEDIQKNIQADAQYNPKVTIQISAQTQPLIVSIDPHLFRSALLNLVLNGMQAMQEEGALHISLFAEEFDVCIEISDTGIGIPEENLNKIWTPYFTTKDQGNGLGLAITHKIINAHHGSIEVTSKVGKGTKFIIKIPKI